MGRPTRIKGADATYHITSRTNGKKLFIKSKQDQKALCKIIRKIILKYAVTLYGFTPMTNHFHMLLHIHNDADLSQIMNEIKCQYAKYFNRKHRSSGHFWGERFHSTIVQDDQHALACLRYLDRNPVKAGLVDHPGKWFLHSFPSYAYGHRHSLLPLRPHPTYLALAKTRDKRHILYQDFVLADDPKDEWLFGKLYKLQIFGSAEFENSIIRN